MYTAPTLGTKQSGATFVVSGDQFPGSMECNIPRQLDALVNMGIVFTLPAVTYGAAETNAALTMNNSGKTVANVAIDDSDAGNFGVDNKLDPSTEANQNAVAYAQVVNHANAQGLVKHKGNLAAYIQFAQYAIIKKVKVSLNSSSVVEMTGEELLVLHDIYGCGIHGLDVLSNSYFNTNAYPERCSQSSSASVHIISLSLWWCHTLRVNQGDAGQTFKNAFLPSSVAYSPLTVHVEFGTPQSVGGKSTDGGATAAKGTFSTNASDLSPKFIFDGYFMTSAEKEIIHKTAQTQPYRKTGSQTLAGTNAKSTVNLNFNFVGADIIAWAKHKTDAALGKHGQYGQNDAEVNYLKSVQYSLNHNNTAPCDHITTQWAFLNGATHMPRLGCLYFSAAPGSDIQAVMYNNPIRCSSSCGTRTRPLPTTRSLC